MDMQVLTRGFKQKRLFVMLLTASLLAACQPPANTQEMAGDEGAVSESPIVIGEDSVTMTQDYILNLKSSRYQPSLGLEGTLEPIKQARFDAAQNLLIKEVLVIKGQWVEKGTPLLLISRATSPKPKETDKQIDNNGANSIGSGTGTNIDSDNDASSENDDKREPNVASAAPTATETQNVTIDQTDSPMSAPIPAEESISQDAQDTAALVVISELRPEDSVSAEDDIITTESKHKKRIQDSEASTVPEATGNGMGVTSVRATFTGRVSDLYVGDGEQVAAHKPLLNLSDDTDLRFVAALPIQAKSQLSVGQTVSFSADQLSENFSGQISHLLTGARADQLSVYVHVIRKEGTTDALTPKMHVTGRVNYGQIEVGTIVPERAIHDVDLSELQKPPYQPLSPLKANVWIIKQDQRLTRQPVEVIEYNPSTGQYLIAGISNDSLICLADLPIESAGKKVVVS